MTAFYKKFIRPLSTDTDQAEREIVLNYLLVGIFGLAVVALIDTVFAPIISHESYQADRVLTNVITVALIVGLYILARYGRRYRTVAVILTLLIAAFGCDIAFSWGVLNTNSILLFSLAVVMAGVLIGARYSLYMTVGIAAVLAFLQHGESTGALHPDLTWLSTQPTKGDVIGFSAILFVIALVSWLYNRQMELSLRRAQRSERALQHQKKLLEIKVEKRAQQLAAAQLEKMQELYRFAELGQLSTSLFHDLANHLSTVSLDIEGLTAREESDLMRRISENVGHIETIVKRVREQIGGKNAVEVFSVLHEIDEVLKILAPAARQAKVEVVVERDPTVKPGLRYKGDIIRFRQIVLNLIANAIESYPAVEQRAKDTSPRVVALRLGRERTVLSIEVADQGAGIPEAELTKVFRPFYTTKKGGIGIGLFIVKQVVEKDFGGSIAVSSEREGGTSMTVLLPKSYYA